MAAQPALGPLIDQLAWRAIGTIPLLQDKKLKNVLTKLPPPLGCVRGKLVKMTIPQGAVGYHLYAAAANQEAGIESRDMRHHCKQQWQTVNQIHQF